MGTWSEAGRTVIALAAVCAALGVLARFKPVRWLFRTLFAAPFSGWLRGEVADVVDEKLEPVNAALDRGRAQLEAIGVSVNNVQPGDPKLIERVAATQEAAERAAAAAETAAATVAALQPVVPDAEPPTPPAPTPAKRRRR